jgi:uncharacterized protein (DUF427 family)
VRTEIVKFKRIEPKTGQESVWDYPRPPRLEDCSKHIRVIFNGVTIAETNRAKRVLETSHPPTYYIPPEDVKMEFLRAIPRTSWCEWKGKARYYDVTVGEKSTSAAAWTYPDPVPEFASLRNYLAFYPGQMDACYVAGEQVQAQVGDFYGGWITSDIVGPFKGAPGTWGW